MEECHLIFGDIFSIIQERESWKAKERHYQEKLDEMSDVHLEAMEQQKVWVSLHWINA